MTSLDGLTHVRLVGDVLRIAIATADNGTALDSDAVNQGTTALRALAAGEIAAGAILLVGDGANFCAGGNVRAFAAADDRPAYILGIANELHDLVRLLAAATVPVVAAVHGWAAGAGMSLVCAADIALGGASTKLRPAYPGIGLTPDGGMSWNLPRIVGSRRAREILLTDAVLDADEAVRLGVLSRVVADDEVQEQAQQLAQRLATGPTASYAGIKELLARSEESTLSDQLDAEAAAISAASGGATGREGVDAFVAKRAPDFTSLR
ncbi:enoyl-CoA hydratase/isomerase family protein [Rhodococcus sp. NPDC058505]|uniref:enoyl-CoA hydratase/isomerase family protein n=1 Tax=unclassified Rhodococcus (in: high G+C Gram-positive bacteria) TaxID=192944 RepID=UPI0036558275